MDLAKWFEVVGFSGLIGIFVTMVWNAYRERLAARQTNFSSYSGRYAALMAEIVRSVDIACGFDPTHGDQRALAVQFFMLLSEEEYLAGRKLIDAGIAGVWKEGLDVTMSHPWFRGAWAFARARFDFDGAFADTVDAVTSRLSSANPPDERPPGSPSEAPPRASTRDSAGA